MEHELIFEFFHSKISGSNGTSEMLVLFFGRECFKRKFMFHFFKVIFDNSLRLSRLKELIFQMKNTISE